MTVAGRAGRSPRRAARDARRGAVSGSGPTPDGAAVGRNPGARGAFGLFGEVLVMGIVITVVSLAVITLPAVLAAAIRHLRRYIAAESSGIDAFRRDLLRALPGGAGVGAVAVAASSLLIADILVARSGALPGGGAIGVLGWVGLVAVGVLLLASASRWTPELGWRSALRTVPSFLRTDPVGCAYLAATAVFVGVLTSVLPPLLIPALGCAALAAVAIPERPRR
jgi:hypothetical protein